MGLLPSVAEGDLSGVLESVERIQSLGFKRVEWRLQSDQVRELAKAMSSRGFAVGLSSFGPALYTFPSTEREGRELESTFGGFVTYPNNMGARTVWNSINSS